MKTVISLIGAEGSIGSELASFLRKKSDIFDFLKRNTKNIYITLNNSLNNNNSVDLSKIHSINFLLALLPKDLE